MQLHRKYAGDGLVVMSLNIEQSEWEQKDKVLNFLTKQEATFPNYIFKDRPQKVDDWLEKYDAFFAELKAICGRLRCASR